MKINPFLSNPDTLTTLVSILGIDTLTLQQLGTEEPIGRLILLHQTILAKKLDISNENPWVSRVRDRYPNLNTLLHQVLNATLPNQVSAPESYHGWHFTITKYSQPLHIKLFQSPNADQLVITLLDDYLVAIHQGLITSEQFCFTRQQTVVHLLKEATGWSNQTIANTLFCSSETIKKHLRDIRLKQDHLLQHQQYPVAIGLPAGFAVAGWFM